MHPDDVPNEEMSGQSGFGDVIYALARSPGMATRTFQQEATQKTPQEISGGPFEPRSSTTGSTLRQINPMDFDIALTLSE